MRRGDRQEEEEDEIEERDVLMERGEKVDEDMLMSIIRWIRRFFAGDSDRSSGSSSDNIILVTKSLALIL